MSNLKIRKYDLVKLARQVSEEEHRPLIVYDTEKLKEKYRELIDAFSKITTNIQIAYSFKTNPVLAQNFYELGSIFTVTSKKHLEDALRIVGYKNADMLIYNQPAIKKEAMWELLDLGVHVIADSESQLKAINEYGKKHGKIIEIGIRADTEIRQKSDTFAAAESRLGIPYDEIEPMLDKNKFANIQVAGVLGHLASQITEVDVWKRYVTRLSSLLLSLSKRGAYYLDLGGGYPIKYQKPVPSLGKIVSAIKPVLKSVMKKLPDFKLIVEPGRSVAGPCGILLAEVVDVRKIRDKDWVVVDTSIFASMGDRIVSNMALKLPCAVANKIGKKKSKKVYYLRGASPCTKDLIGDFNNLPKIEAGDMLAFYQAGAYCTAFTSDFAGVRRPEEILLD